MSEEEIEVKAEEEGVGLDWASQLIETQRDGGNVTEVSAVCLPNTLSRVLRVTICYKTATDKEQKLSVIVKRPPLDPFTKMFLAESGLDDSENIFYNEVAPILIEAGAGTVAPRCIRARPDELVIADAAAKGFASANFAAGLTEHQARAALATAAILHARSFGKAAAAARRGGAARAAGVRALQRGLARLAALTRREGVGAAAAKLAARAPALLRPAAAPPPSPAILAHGDLWAGNLLFRDVAKTEDCECIAVDWRLARAAGPSGAVDDVALLILSSLETEDRRQLTPRLVQYYCQRLTSETDKNNPEAESMCQSICVAVNLEGVTWRRACLRALALCAGGADALRTSPNAAQAAQRRLLAAAEDLLVDLDESLLVADSPPPSPPPPPLGRKPP